MPDRTGRTIYLGRGRAMKTKLGEIPYLPESIKAGSCPDCGCWAGQFHSQECKLKEEEGEHDVSKSG